MAKQSISTVEELKRLISGGEGQRLEFKREFAAAQVGRSICALANAKGGILLIGVEDDGSIAKGRNFATDRNIHSVDSIARSMDPPVTVQTAAVGTVLCVTVSEQHNKPCFYDGKCFIRKGRSSRKLTKDELRDFFHAEGALQFDAMPCERFSLKGDLGDDNWELFRGRAGLPAAKGSKRVDLLRNLNLIDAEGRMTNAGAWLLARDITKFNLSARVKCALFEGTTRGGEMLDKAQFDGDIHSMVDGAMKWLRANLNGHVIRDGSPAHEVRLELPAEALREAVVNAVGHRDYRSQGSNVEVIIFRDRVEIRNPGGLMAGMTKEELDKRSVRRNELLFSILGRMGLVEGYGTGVQIMRDRCREHGLRDPEFAPEEKAFTVTLFRQVVPAAGAEPVDKADAMEREILRLLHEHAVLSAVQLAEHMEVDASDRVFREPLNRLRERGRIEYTVPDKPRSRNQAYRLTASEMRRGQQG